MARTSSERIGLDGPSLGLLIGGPAVVGGVLGWFLPPVARWAAGQGWLPAQGLLEVLRDRTDAVPVLVRVVVLVLVGVGVGLGLCHQARTLEITDAELWVVEGGSRTRWSRRQVSAAALNDRRLSLRDADDAELVEVSLDSPPEQGRRALTDHGWPLVT